MTAWLLALLALLGGAALAVQTGVNAQLRVGLGHPVAAALCNVLVGLSALLLYALLLRVPVPSTTRLSHVAWWQWTGGVLGAAYLVVIIVLAPKLGAATLVSLIVAGQLFTALLLDHYGLLGFPLRQLSAPRVAGALLLIAGVVLIRRS